MCFMFGINIVGRSHMKIIWLKSLLAQNPPRPPPKKTYAVLKAVFGFYYTLTLKVEGCTTLSLYYHWQREGWFTGQKFSQHTKCKPSLP